ncbi:MAG: PhzF family phenazine biosynthesis protein [Candidatus Methanoperedens sp.]|nr:PhzF family phenazine biosynthesis protein [Candidatus Methanoperedens sp.]MCZ7369681.1 PhzF family phenazine biosynthesis protein [Candidatus Methanoperedens sp.]
MRSVIFQVDAFTDKPFTGNPAAVCILPEPRDECWMQKVAQEMNVSETAFLYRQKDSFNLRWFTPAVEVDLCGHATLASAHVLWEAGYMKPDQQVRFYTRSGLLTAEHNGDWIELDFPAEPEEQVAPPLGLARALGVTPKYVGKNRFGYLVEVDSEETVRNLKPNFGLLSEISAEGVIVTSLAATQSYDFVSRFFAPKLGINEDPVTGSAHCCLGPFWRKHLNKNEFIAYQASGRGGVVRVRLSGKRVYPGGQAVTVLRGELTRSLSRTAGMSSDASER